jgi:LAO/AO transport system kinase
VQALIDSVLQGDERAVARACRVIDDRAAGFQELLRGLYARTGRASVIGVTGTGGAGKSSLVDALVGRLRAEGKRVGVLAVDPSSPFTGGAILGDRVRMQRHFEDAGVFIRSIASRGAQGGLSRSAREQGFVLDAAGYDVILVETLGVGQDELEVSEWVDSTVLVCAPGMGDEVQALKSGILEIADVFVVNKADRPGSDALAADLEQRISLGRAVRAGPARQHGHGAFVGLAAVPDDERWEPPIVKCVAVRDEGTPELLQAILRHRAWLASTPGKARTLARQRMASKRLLQTLLAEHVAAAHMAEIDLLAERVARRELDPYEACERIHTG